MVISSISAIGTPTYVSRPLARKQNFCIPSRLSDVGIVSVVGRIIPITLSVMAHDRGVGRRSLKQIAAAPTLHRRGHS
jgi:hypothetical protein